jgi:hypothetical protein
MTGLFSIKEFDIGQTDILLHMNILVSLTVVKA